MNRIPRKTVSNIRTRSAAPLGDAASPRRKYTRLANLAFEKERRDRDARLFRERMENGEGRLAKIEQEEARLLASIEAQRARM
jgi:cell division septum initiation protein DivIVA